MELIAFASFAVLIVAWLIAPTKSLTVVEEAQERGAA